MKLYIDNDGVIRWNPKGWPEPLEAEYVKGGIHYKGDPEKWLQDMDKAKAESVPVKNQDMVHFCICEYNSVGILVDVNLTEDTFYEVPDDEIKKEWL